MAKKFAIHVHRHPDGFFGGKWHYTVTDRRVRVLAIAEGWAMVRFNQGTYCVPTKELKEESK